jgi:hemerythrin
MPLHLRLTLADDIHRVHAALHHDLERLPEALASPAEARRFLAELRDHVAQHFRCEEEGGYMAAVLQRRPQDERVVRRLLAEHQPLMEGLNALLRDAEAARQIEDGFRSRVGAWAEWLRRHEAEENVLVEDAFNQDIGQKD